MSILSIEYRHRSEENDTARRHKLRKRLGHHSTGNVLFIPSEQDLAPEGTPRLAAFGKLALMHDEFVRSSQNTDTLDPLIDRIAEHSLDDFAQWEEEIKDKSSPNHVINRSDAYNAINLWIAHPSDQTEQAARSLLNYAVKLSPNERQAWAQSFRSAFEKMVIAHNSDSDNLTLDTALEMVQEDVQSQKAREVFESNPQTYRFLYEGVSHDITRVTRY